MSLVSPLKILYLQATKAHTACLHAWDTDSVSHPNNALFICQTSNSISSACIWDWCLGVKGPVMAYAFQHTNMHTVWLVEMDALCIWAFTKESEFDRHSISLWWKAIPTMGKSISYFLRRQEEEKQHFSSVKLYAFHQTCIPPSFRCFYFFCFPFTPASPLICFGLVFFCSFSLAISFS